jgi:GTP cyclohydrolase II
MTALRPTPSVPADATGSYDGATAGPPRRHRVRPVVVVSLPTPAGEFEAHAFEVSSGTVYLALVKGEVAGAGSVLTRVHSECLTGDVLGSLRCDCGLQLRIAMREIAAEGRGVLLYATGHEGRGIGLINKLRAYTHQDRGLDTIDANLHLGLPVDARSFGDAADVLMGLGITSVRLLTNNPKKVAELASAGVHVEGTVPIPTSPHFRNSSYLRSKEMRLGHTAPAAVVPGIPALNSGAGDLLGAHRPQPRRPYVALKYAQTLDGRIATATGDSRWISEEAERRITHSLRAASDGVLVGIGTILRDDPRLTVRMVPGASPVRIVIDSTLRIPLSSQVIDGAASTIVLTTERSPTRKRRALRERQVGVRVVESGPRGVDLHAALVVLRDMGIRSLLVEGGSRIITSMLAERLADRLIVAIAPTIVGSGTEAVGDLSIHRIAQGVRLANRSVHVLDDDVLLAWDVAEARNGVLRDATRAHNI